MRLPKWFGPVTYGSWGKMHLEALDRSSAQRPRAERGRGAALRPRLGVGEVDEAVLGEVRVERDVEQPALALREDARACPRPGPRAAVGA